jgi:DNA-binding MarR family transcriptional regulator
MTSYLFGKTFSDSGDTLQAVRILREYNRPIPQDFLVKLLKWNKADAKKQLKSLEEAGLIKLEGDNVALVVREK